MNNVYVYGVFLYGHSMGVLSEYGFEANFISFLICALVKYINATKNGVPHIYLRLCARTHQSIRHCKVQLYTFTEEM